jgi:histidinol-phosphate aminotransferase
MPTLLDAWSLHLATDRSVGRSAYCDLVCYTVDQAPMAVDLRDNTNLWGVPPTAQSAIREAAVAVSRYPQIYARELRVALAEYMGVEAEMVVTGCGSDDVIDACFRALADPGDRVALPSPCFATAETFARMNGLSPVVVTLNDDRSVDIGRLGRSDARVIYLSSPNNPTGGLVRREEIERLLNLSRASVILDEAYGEYAGVGSCDMIAHCDRLVVVRTLSKAFGLAGLRVGYGVGDPAVIRMVEKARGPYKVNSVAERAAVAALRADREWVAERVCQAIINRDRLAVVLRTLGLTPLPSAANFLLCPTADARTLTRLLAAVGVGVRCFVGLSTIGDAIRITVGPWPLMEIFLERLAAVLERKSNGEVAASCA